MHGRLVVEARAPCFASFYWWAAPIFVASVMFGFTGAARLINYTAHRFWFHAAQLQREPSLTQPASPRLPVVTASSLFFLARIGYGPTTLALHVEVPWQHPYNISPVVVSAVPLLRGRDTT
ncbi:hypothetical protein NDU88_001660 [Pleurodeles waltl]|uniref:Uncharacterized protein n=1 Tax=Pleurodeles waltl TaxID=8319 RepID=A0AAV7UTE2_PLEWA|nr:hypothetical protein NDU88_001660 [Pleurodeles waltl]